MRDFYKKTVSCKVTFQELFEESGHLIIDGRSGRQIHYAGKCGVQGEVMAFVRRKGNSFYLVHNVRRGGKVKQLHLARLGEHARITDTIVREVSKKHPFVDLNWRALRDQLNQRINLADPDSPQVQKLISTLRALHLDLADLFPPALQISDSPAVAKELLVQLRLLQTTIQVKLEQFGPGSGRFGSSVAAAAARH